MKTAVVMALALFSACAEATAGDLVGRIENGERAVLTEELRSQGTQHPDRAATFYELGLVAPLGTERYLRDAGRLSDPDLEQQRLISLARFCIAAGEPHKAVDYLTQLSKAFPKSSHHDEAEYLLARAEIANGTIKPAEKRLDELSRDAAQPWKGWGLYGQAQCALLRHDTADAIRLIRKAASMEKHAASGPALLLLGQLSDAYRRPEDAYRYLAMYRETYPHGFLPVVERSVAVDDRADQAAGLEYAVQVGVFGDKANAERQRSLFAKLKYPISLKGKTIAGQRYTAVWVGKFKSREDAQRVRRELEEKFDDTYRVVAIE
jgi:Flp pilus assembly protein TadD